jgi:hypothetical protein
MIILCQGDFKKQTEKLVTLLLYNMRTVEEKMKNGYSWYAVSNPRVNDAVSTSEVTERLKCEEFALRTAKYHVS